MFIFLQKRCQQKVEVSSSPPSHRTWHPRTAHTSLGRWWVPGQAGSPSNLTQIKTPPKVVFPGGVSRLQSGTSSVYHCNSLLSLLWSSVVALFIMIVFLDIWLGCPALLFFFSQELAKLQCHFFRASALSLLMNVFMCHVFHPAFCFNDWQWAGDSDLLGLWGGWYCSPPPPRLQSPKMAIFN